MVRGQNVHLNAIVPVSLHATFRKRCFDLGTTMRDRIVHLIEEDCRI